MDRSRRSRDSPRRPTYFLAALQCCTAAFRLRRRTVKQRKSKSRSQGDKYRPTGGTHGTAVYGGRVLRTKVKRDRARQRVRNERTLSLRHCSETLEVSIAAAESLLGAKIHRGAHAICARSAFLFLRFSPLKKVSRTRATSTTRALHPRAIRF